MVRRPATREAKRRELTPVHRGTTAAEEKSYEANVRTAVRQSE